MSETNPFARPKPNPKRAEPRRVRGREILHGEAKTQRRWEIFERSEGRCEAFVRHNITEQEPEIGYKRCNRPITWDSMHWSHKKHGGRKCDCMDCGIASCEDCHRNQHNAGGKPVARKPGRRMNQTEALAYWNGDVCFCGEPKGKRWSFCFDCLQKLSPQLRDDLEKVIGKDYLETMAAAETELLSWKPEEERTAS